MLKYTKWKIHPNFFTQYITKCHLPILPFDTSHPIHYLTILYITTGTTVHSPWRHIASRHSILLSVSTHYTPLLGVANGTSKSFALTNVSSDLEISTVFAKSLEVSFILHLFRCEVLNILFSVSASRRVSDFTIRQPYYSTLLAVTTRF